MTYGEDNKQFLQGLKVGDVVAVRSRRMDSFGRSHGYEQFTITKTTPKRSRYEALDPHGKTWTFNQHGQHRVGERWSAHTYYLEPMTQKIAAEQINDTVRIKAMNRLGSLEHAAREVSRKCLEVDIEVLRVVAFQAEELLKTLAGHYKER